jgi:hypothetical protein
MSVLETVIFALILVWAPGLIIGAYLTCGSLASINRGPGRWQSRQSRPQESAQDDKWSLDERRGSLALNAWKQEFHRAFTV